MLVYRFPDTESSEMAVASRKLKPNLHSREKTKMLLQINLISEFENTNNQIMPSCSVRAKQNKIADLLDKKDESCISGSNSVCFALLFLLLG